MWRKYKCGKINLKNAVLNKTQILTERKKTRAKATHRHTSARRRRVPAPLLHLSPHSGEFHIGVASSVVYSSKLLASGASGTVASGVTFALAMAFAKATFCTAE